MTTTVVHTWHEEDVAVIQLVRPPVNAITERAVEGLTSALDAAEHSESTRAIVLTGSGAFFSFGFDVPLLIDWPEDRFADFLRAYCAFLVRLTECDKPVVAAINGHAVAGGYMVALACDRRLAGRTGRFGLNEITFGASLFQPVAQRLIDTIGGRAAWEVMSGGEFYDVEAALSLGLIDRSTEGEDLLPAALAEASRLGRYPDAFAHIKSLFTRTATPARSVEESIQRFTQIWYSEGTRRALGRVRIRGHTPDAHG